MWKVRGEYEDGSVVEAEFIEDPNRSDFSQRYDLECWLMEQPKVCVRYSIEKEEI